MSQANGAERQLMDSRGSGTTKCDTERSLQKKDWHARWVDDVTGQELPWPAVRRAREEELKYLRDRGVHATVAEQAAIARYWVTPVDTEWIDTDKPSEGEPVQVRSRIVGREFESGQTRILCRNPPNGGIQNAAPKLQTLTGRL